jgi:hypothetical protein
MTTPATPQSPSDAGRFEVSLELAKEVLKHTPEGTFIHIDDLKRAVDRQEAKVQPGTVKHTSFAMARQAALKDPELKAAFERQQSPDRREGVKP